MTGESLINDLELPFFLISLLIMRSSSISKSILTSCSRTCSFKEKIPSTIHFEFGSLRILLVDLAPIKSSIAPKIIDLPAPVSPVITVNSFLKSITVLVINA